ncbi:MAG: hypothetical protein ACRC3A_08785 [Culicoidibacterales bacterium]
MSINIKSYRNLPMEEVLVKLKKESKFDLISFYKEHVDTQYQTTPNLPLVSDKKRMQHLGEQLMELANQLPDLSAASSSSSGSKWQQIIDELQFEQSKSDVKHIEFYNGVGISYHTELLIDKMADVVADDVVLINKATREVVAFGKLEPVFTTNSQAKQYVIFPKEQISFDKMKGITHYQLVTFATGGIGKTIDCQYSLKEVTENIDSPLCIDFGTSNTTMGTANDSCSEQAEIVEFFDIVAYEEIKRKKEQKELHDIIEADTFNRKMIPTIVYVKNCENPEQIEYLFGYEARKQLLEDKLDTKASVFYELKRWMLDLDRSEAVRDINGFEVHVSRRTIVQAYLKYIIELAEVDLKQKFHKLHFSAPVKMKGKFLSEIAAMLPEYEVLSPSESVDEGIAIIYNHIHSNLQEAQSEKQQITILDCGGGTTDLATCSYTIAKDDWTRDQEIKIETQAINGDNNFGGNNLTYRILQLLKIKLAATINGEVTMMQELIPTTLDEMLVTIDKQKPARRASVDEILKTFEQAYIQAEKTIPTIFLPGNENSPLHDDVQKLTVAKKNYYFLWETAEKIKKEFFRRTDLLTVDFNSAKEATHNAKIKLDLQDEADAFMLQQWCVEKNSWEAIAKPDIDISHKEVEQVLQADIYYLLAHVLGDDELNLKQKYALSGQSCKISLFNSLFKEFVPGRRMRTKSKTDISEENLKLQCVLGAIQYRNDVEVGKIKAIITNNTAKLCYTIKAKDTDLLSPVVNAEVGTRSVQTNDYVTTFVPAQLNTTRLEFEIHTTSQTLAKMQYNYDGSPLQTGLTTSELLNVATAKIDKNEQIMEALIEKMSRPGYVYFAAVPDAEMSGFYLLDIQKNHENDQDSFDLRSCNYYLFDQTATTVFFDGNR